jgi:hypothetical protein
MHKNGSKRLRITIRCMGNPPVDPHPLAALKFVSNQGPWSSLIFTLAFSVFIICHCRWTRDPVISSVVALNLITPLNHLATYTVPLSLPSRLLPSSCRLTQPSASSCRRSHLVICWLRLEARSQAKPSPKKPSQAKPKWGLERAFGLA